MTRTISRLAKELGINIETVRFYERKKLIKQNQVTLYIFLDHIQFG